MFRLKSAFPASLVFFSLLHFSLATPLLAQTRDPKLEELAAKLIANASGKLPRERHSPGQLSCLVMDFEEAAGHDRRLGVWFAGEFSQALSRTWPETAVLDRSKFDEALSLTGLEKNGGLLKAIFAYYAPHVDPRVVIVGQVLEGKNTEDLRVQMLDAKGKRLGEASERFEMTDSRRALAKSEPPAKLFVPHWPAVPYAGMGGYRDPKCIRCSPPPYTEAARTAKFKGTVFLLVLIGKDGTVRDAALTSGAPFGLSESAIATVKRWRFEPVLGPDGKPAMVQVAVEINLKMLND